MSSIIHTLPCAVIFSHVLPILRRCSAGPCVYGKLCCGFGRCFRGHERHEESGCRTSFPIKKSEGQNRKTPPLGHYRVIQVPNKTPPSS
ncbi:hypothetical protein GGS20DRAFT_126133 [Poronia punctata]|nr:hypothetical protein GGS20DRAFT_126133 [Poronia punctata]